MRAQQYKPYHLARHTLLQQIPHRKEIAKAFGHLLPLDLQHLVMQPIPRKLPRRVGAAALCDLVFVVRELQIQPAAVDVKAFAQQIKAHRRAFDMPTRAAMAPGAVPARLVTRRGLPEHKIHRVAFVIRHLYTLARAHVLQAPPRERAVSRIGVHVKQHMAFGLISMALIDQALDHRYHLPDIPGRAWLMGGAQRPERVHILVIPVDGLIGDLANIPPRLGGLGVYLVIHIGEIAHIGHMRLTVNMAQQPVKHIKHHHRAGIADMGAVINRGAADIHADIPGVDRHKFFFAADFGVGELDHRFSRRGFAATGLTFQT